MNLSVIIPVHNRLQQTKRCLEILYNLVESNQELKSNIVVVDDGSEDNTSGWIKEHYPGIVLLSGDGNLWWSGAITLGAKHALDKLDADYILLWNNDSVPDKCYFDNLGKILESNPEQRIIGSKIYDLKNDNIIWSLGGIFNPHNGKRYMLGSGRKDNEEFNKQFQVDWLPGMGTVIHKSVFKKIGFWDYKNFPQYHGDSDFTLRAKEQGFEIIVHSDLKLWNDKSTSGLIPEGKVKNFLRSFVDIRSNKNIVKNFKFYTYHGKSVLVYKELIIKYIRYIFRFIKGVN